MSRKLTVLEGQQNLENFLTPATKKEDITLSAKKRTPPSAEKPTPKRAKESAMSSQPAEDQLPRETIECMKIAMQELIDQKLDPIEHKINQLLDTKKLQVEQQTELNKMKTAQSELYRKCLKIENENNKLKARLERLECKMLDGNVILHGLREDVWELEENRKEKVYKAISATVDEENETERMNIARGLTIRKTTRIGKYRVGKNRPVSIMFEKKSHADVLFENRSWLPRGMFLNREYTAEVEHQRKLLRPILKLARSKEEYKGKCKMEDNYLVIYGTKYTINDLNKLPNDLSGYHASSKSNGSTTVFFGELSPFSNFHTAHFTIDDKHYFCSEQYIQEQKSLEFKDTTTANKILLCETAQECKNLSRNVVGYREERWKKKAVERCLPGIKAKFTQNPALAQLLLSTNNSKLAEASYDKIWGTGVPLSDENCLDEKLWNGIGIQGNLLMQVRAEIVKSPVKRHEEQMDTIDTQKTNTLLLPTASASPEPTPTLVQLNNSSALSVVTEVIDKKISSNDTLQVVTAESTAVALSVVTDKTAKQKPSLPVVTASKDNQTVSKSPTSSPSKASTTDPT